MLQSCVAQTQQQQQLCSGEWITPLAWPSPQVASGVLGGKNNMSFFRFSWVGRKLAVVLVQMLKDLKDLKAHLNFDMLGLSV